jgi:hypothetical protein
VRLPASGNQLPNPAPALARARVLKAPPPDGYWRRPWHRCAPTGTVAAMPSIDRCANRPERALAVAQSYSMSLKSRRPVHRPPRQDHKDGDHERQRRGVAAFVEEEQPSRDGAPNQPGEHAD